MSFRLGFISLLLFVVSFVSCDSEPASPGVLPDVIEKGDTARSTLLVYMMAENSLSSYAANDVNEIVEAASSVPRDCRLFVYTDDNGFPRLVQYFAMTDGGAGSSEYLPFSADICSSDTSTLGAVFDYILNDYPTQKLDLVLWSHGSGWLRAPLNSAPSRSIGVDNGENSHSNSITSTIEIEELASLLERLPVRVGRIMFDACFMQCVESAYALRHAAEWIIASPAEIPGDGALYSSLIPLFFDTDEPECILDSYIESYCNEPAGAVMSAVCTQEMQNLADVTFSYVIKYFNKDKKRSYADVFSYLPGGKYNSNPAYPSFYDMNAVMKKYLTTSEYSHWREVFEKAVVHVATSSRWYSAICKRVIEYDSAVGCGISLYLPQNNSRNEVLNSDFRSTEWYSAAGWQTAGW